MLHIMSDPSSLFSEGPLRLKRVHEVAEYVFDQDSRRPEEVNLAVARVLGWEVVAQVSESHTSAYDPLILISAGRAPSGTLRLTKHLGLDQLWGTPGDPAFDQCKASGCASYILRNSVFETDDPAAMPDYRDGEGLNQLMVLSLAVNQLKQLALGHPERDLLSPYNFGPNYWLQRFEGHRFSYLLQVANRQAQSRRIATGRVPLDK
jgi:hypothetical protein